MSGSADNRWLRGWYQDARWPYLLLPLAGLFRMLSALRRVLLTRFAQTRLPVPVLVVGNITLGGTGKTPVIIALVNHLQSRGYTPGVISRGYGGRAPAYPLRVTSATRAEHSGDEPLHIAQATGCAVCVAPDRVAAGRLLVAEGCDILLSDDGLQHYRLGRDWEMAVVDGQRGFGNGFCLPAGPLREPVARLGQVDWVVINGSGAALPALADSCQLEVEPVHWQRLSDGAVLPLTHFGPDTRVHAIAGIGNPARFYTTLTRLGMQFEPHDFPDHHKYTPGDLAFADDRPLVMTAKDAVKCRGFAEPHWYSLAIRATLPDSFWRSLDTRLSAPQSFLEAEQ